MNYQEKFKAICKIDPNASIQYSAFSKQFYVSSAIEVKEYDFLIHGTEHRNTIEECVEAYYEYLIGKTIIMGAYTENRREFVIDREQKEARYAIVRE